MVDLLVFLGDLFPEEVYFALVFGAEGGDLFLVILDEFVEGGLQVGALGYDDRVVDVGLFLALYYKDTG